MILFLASGNSHKLRELNELLAQRELRVSLDSAKALGGMPDVEENGETFEANARIKAEALRPMLESGQWVLADDSGLEVDALDGAPGVLSARYAGVHGNDSGNTEKLLSELSLLDGSMRRARFRCSLVLMREDGEAHVFDGRCEGVIAREKAGIHGFGYDPVFIPEGYRNTFSELGDAVKSAISHRARAMAKLMDWIQERM